MKNTLVKSEPFEEVVIMESTKFSTIDELARFVNISAGGKPTGMYWANGIAFIYYPIPTTTEIAAKTVIEEKKVYWSFVSYAPLPQYRSVIETKERIIVPLINMSNSQLFQKVAEWLKDQS